MCVNLSKLACVQQQIPVCAVYSLNSIQQGFKGTVINWTLPSSHVWLLWIMLVTQLSWNASEVNKLNWVLRNPCFNQHILNNPILVTTIWRFLRLIELYENFALIKTLGTTLFEFYKLNKVTAIWRLLHLIELYKIRLWLEHIEQPYIKV